MSDDVDTQLGCLGVGIFAIVAVLFFFVFYVLPTVILIGAVAGALVSLYNFVVSIFNVYRQRIQSNRVAKYEN